MKLRWKKYELRLEQPFVLSYGSFNTRSAYIVALEEQGQRGLGEATAISYYGWTETLIENTFQKIEVAFEDGMSIPGIMKSLSMIPPVRNALNCAWVDLQARLKKKKIKDFYEFPEVANLPMSSITITGDTQDGIRNQIRRHDWPIYKIKMGTSSDRMKLELMNYYSDKLFRIDANTGWTIAWVKEHADLLNQENIELIEQPFPVDKAEYNLVLKEHVRASIIADESCQRASDIASCAEFFDGVNVKLMKCGGWDHSLKVIQRAREENLTVMIGCMTETSVGISHAVQMLSQVDLADIDGSYLLANDPATGSYLQEGQVVEGKEMGSGAGLLVSDF